MRQLQLDVVGTLSSQGLGKPLSGSITVSQLQLLGISYQRFDDGKGWNPVLPLTALDVKLQNLSVSVNMELLGADRISACVKVPLDQLTVDTNYKVLGVAARLVTKMLGECKATIGKAIEQAIASLLKSALSAVPDALDTAAISIALKKSEILRPDSTYYTLSVNATVGGDWSKAGALQEREKAVPPKPVANKAFGSAWDVLQTRMRKAPVGTQEKLSFGLEHWVEVSAYQAIDILVPSLKLNGSLDQESESEDLLSFEGTLQFNLDAQVRANANDHGGWDYGQFLATNSEVTNEKGLAFNAVLSCGALYLVEQEHRFKLRQNGSAKANWAARFDLLKKGTLDKGTHKCNTPKKAYVGQGKDKKFLLCLASPLFEALTWETDKFRDIMSINSL